MELIQPIELNQDLHRYMNFEKFMDLISTKKIFLSKISAFDDHLEGSFTPVNAFMLNGSAKMLSLVVTSMPRVDNSPESRKEREVAITAAEQECDEHEMSGLFKGFPYKDYGDQFEHIQKQHREWINANCWHASNSESMAMWKIYGESDSSVCIISDVSLLKESITAPEEISLTLAKIQYIDHSKDNFKSFHPLAPYIHKSTPYTFEQEYRLIAYNPDSKLLDERPKDDAGVLLNVNINRLIKEVRVSHKAPAWFFNMVKRFSKDYISPDINVVRSEMDNKAIY